MRLRERGREFLEFVREQGIVGLAVAFVLGGAVSKVVSSLVQDILQPLIGFLFGKTDGLKALKLGPILYGSFLANFIDFLIIAAVVYFVFKSLRLETLDKKKS